MFNSSSSLLLGQPSLLKHFHPAALFYFCPATVKTAGGSSQVTLFVDPARGGEWWWWVVVGGGGGEVGPRIEGLFFFFWPFMGEGSRIFFVFPSLWFVAKKRKQGRRKRREQERQEGGHSSGRALIAVGTMSLDDDVITSANPTPPKTLC